MIWPFLIQGWCCYPSWRSSDYNWWVFLFGAFLIIVLCFFVVQDCSRISLKFQPVQGPVFSALFLHPQIRKTLSGKNPNKTIIKHLINLKDILFQNILYRLMKKSIVRKLYFLERKNNSLLLKSLRCYIKRWEFLLWE